MKKPWDDYHPINYHDYRYYRFLSENLLHLHYHKFSFEQLGRAFTASL